MCALFNDDDASDEQEIRYTVAELLQKSKRQLSRLWPDEVWVTGELSNVREYPSGHIYMVLKDAEAEISCVMFAQNAANLDLHLEEGDSVQVLAQPTLYVNKGRFQLIIKQIEAQGLGKLHEKFMQFKKQLLSKGWFNSEYKKDIAKIPETIAVVVSIQGAAWKDICTTLQKRYPLVTVKVIDAPAQGIDATKKISAAIKTADLLGCDAILVCRGGGSIEDLWSYNELLVAQAIFEANTPVITGIGHESDETIADYVADLRVATPTAAAVAAVPAYDEIVATYNSLNKRLQSAVHSSLDNASMQLDDASDSALAVADQLITNSRHRLKLSSLQLVTKTNAHIDENKQRVINSANKLSNSLDKVSNYTPALKSLTIRLSMAVKVQISRKFSIVNIQKNKLALLNPSNTLKRGYSIVSDMMDTVITSSSSLSPNQKAKLLLADGEFKIQIEQKMKQSSKLLDLNQK